MTALVGRVGRCTTAGVTGPLDIDCEVMTHEDFECLCLAPLQARPQHVFGAHPLIELLFGEKAKGETAPMLLSEIPQAGPGQS
jgi:hypothetical protein